MRCLILLLALVGAAPSLFAKNPLPLRLVSFDPVIRKVGTSDAQQATLALVEGRKAGKTYTVHLQPSEKTATLVGRQLYLRLPLAWLTKKDAVFYAGELLDLEPASVPADFFFDAEIKDDVADKAGIIARYKAGRIALDGINEVNGTFVPPADPAQWITAADAIAAAKKVHPDGVQGAVSFTVQGASEVDGVLWINSEKNYRDPQSLNVSLPLLAAQDLELRLKSKPADFLKGKRIVVSGIVQQVKITTIKEGEFYFQTQVPLWSAHQIRILP